MAVACALASTVLCSRSSSTGGGKVCSKAGGSFSTSTAASLLTVCSSCTSGCSASSPRSVGCVSSKPAASRSLRPIHSGASAWARSFSSRSAGVVDGSSGSNNMALDSSASSWLFSRRSFNTGRCSFIRDSKNASFSMASWPSMARPLCSFSSMPGIISISLAGCFSVTSRLTLHIKSGTTEPKPSGSTWLRVSSSRALAMAKDQGPNKKSNTTPETF